MNKELVDQKWWNEAGKVIGLQLGGWTYRISGAFWDKDGRYVELTPAIAEALHQIKDKIKTENLNR